MVFVSQAMSLENGGINWNFPCLGQLNGTGIRSPFPVRTFPPSPSSSNQRTLVQTYQEENLPQYLGNSSKYFDFYNTDIDDLSQYELSDPPSSPYTSMDNHPPNYLEIASTHDFPSQIVSKFLIFCTLSPTFFKRTSNLDNETFL